MSVAIERLRRIKYNLENKITDSKYKLIDKLQNFAESEQPMGMRIGDHMRILTSADHKKIPINAGEIHLSDNLPFLDGTDSLLDYARSFRWSTLESLRILANSCQRNDPALDGVEYFYGITPLANRFSERFGFKVSQATLGEKVKYAISYKILITTVAWENKLWRKFLWDINIPQKATISREDLVRIHGSQR